MLPDRNKVMAVSYFARRVHDQDYTPAREEALRAFCQYHAHDFGLLDYTKNGDLR